jgi:preprotein translocase subunit YajC
VEVKMNLLLTIKEWFAQNWMLLVLVAVLAFFVVTTFLKQKKEMNARNELSSSIKKGTKIVTTAGVYGVVDSVENTTDGKVVTIITGTGKNPSTMVIHINAIMGIDNKKAVEETYEEEVVEVEETDAEESDDIEVIEEKVTKKSSKKSSK